MKVLINLFFFISFFAVRLSAQTSLHVDDLTRYILSTNQEEIILIDGLQANDLIDLSIIEVESRMSLEVHPLKNSFSIQSFTNGLTALLPYSNQITLKVKISKAQQNYRRSYFADHSVKKGKQ